MNNENDYEKHVEAFTNHFKAICGDDWEEMTMSEAIHLLSKQTHGLNGGNADNMPEAAEIMGFSRHNVVPTGNGRYQVLTMTEFEETSDGQTLN